MDNNSRMVKEPNKSEITKFVKSVEKGIEAFDNLVAKATQNDNNIRNSSKHEGQELTFNDNRACIHCGKPLPDQLSKKRIYCEEIRDQNGNLIKDCKGAFNRQKNKPEVEMHRDIINEHKTVDERIDAMVAKKGDIVTTEDLNAYDIRLDSSLKFKISDYGLVESYFLKYLIISNPVFKTHKIIRNGQ